MTHIKEESNDRFIFAKAHWLLFTNQRRHVTISNRGKESEMWHWDLGDDRQGEVDVDPSTKLRIILNKSN